MEQSGQLVPEEPQQVLEDRPIIAKVAVELSMFAGYFPSCKCGQNFYFPKYFARRNQSAYDESTVYSKSSYVMLLSLLHSNLHLRNVPPKHHGALSTGRTE